MLRHPKRYIPLAIPSLALLLISVWYITSPTITEAEKNTIPLTPIAKISPEQRYGEHYVVVRLDINTMILHDGTNTQEIRLVSQGKPGSYYETIGGVYTSDYKEPLHFSSIGHVYMPYSVHIFGNYFIHGIPYYPDGTKVSSAFSGGCVRLLDNEAKQLYDFITPTTPIIITRRGIYDFIPTATSTATITSLEMTHLMVATISLEFLTQDNEILGTDGFSLTTRRTILPRLLLQHDTLVSSLYAKSFGKEMFIQAMNDKAKVIGLTNTTFINENSPASTTEEDYARFMNYITTYKSYLLGF